MKTFILAYGDYILCSALGIIIGALTVGLIIRGRLKAFFEPRLTAAESESALLDQKLASCREIQEDLRRRLDQSVEESRRYLARNSELTAENAALTAKVQSIATLERELSEMKSQCDKLQGDLRHESSALAKALERGQHLEKLEDEIVRKEKLYQQAQTQAAQYRTEMAELKTVLDEERKQATEKIALLNEARDQLKIEFQNLAQQIFDEKSRKFGEQNKASLDQLISPLRDQLGSFKKKVEDVYDKESRDRAALYTEISHLKELNQRISKEALNLTRALKGDSKARGSWGEVILERVLEASGLQKGREYDLQVSLRDHQGKRYQPDAIVRLPEGKDVIVDAKVSLKDYEAYYSAEDPLEKEKAFKGHIESLRTHIRTLAAKSYEDLEGVRSLDFVLMFVPVEAAFLAAVEKERAIFSEAFEKNIMVVSPSTLLVTLRTIQNIWRYEYQNRYALDIAKRAGALYDKFVGFVEALEEIGRQLDRARTAYQTAYDRLVGGRGNLVRRSQELKALGVKAGKELPQEMLELAGGDTSNEFDEE